MEINQERAEDALRDLVSTLHNELAFSGLVTEEQWNEAIAPRLMRLGNVMQGLMPDSPTPRVYKFPQGNPAPKEKETPTSESTPV